MCVGGGMYVLCVCVITGINKLSNGIIIAVFSGEGGGGESDMLHHFSIIV